MRRTALWASLTTLALSVSACQHDAAMKGGSDKIMADHVTVLPADVKWKDAESLPPGAKIAVIEGDMNKAEYFCARALLPANYRIPAHWHPNAERVTILSGTLYLGEGESFDESKAHALPAGSYSSMPAGMRHYAWTKGETILQITTMGPWGINYVNAADDPRKKGSK